MKSITQQILQDTLNLHFATEEVDVQNIPGGGLTHSQVRDMLVLVRRLKTRLEVLDAEMEQN